MPDAIQRLGAVGRHAAGGAAILCGAAPDFKRFAAQVTQPSAFSCVLFVLQALLLVFRFFLPFGSLAHLGCIRVPNGQVRIASP
ncbi:MAG: hypothetical protein ABJY83_00285 [Roseibium sp.]